MKRAREEARNLRRIGMSIGDIVKATGASKSSVSVWVRDIELTDEQKQKLREKQRLWARQSAGAQTNRQKGLQLRQSYQDAGHSRAREMRPLHLAGCMLYWAEGGKQRNAIYFVNSDPNMMTFFMRFLREEMNVNSSEVVMYVHCHTAEPDEQKRIAEYWMRLLNLPPTSLRKIFYKKGSVVRHNILENGVCTVRVYKSELVHHIYGAIQEYGGFDNPEWLF